ncbi:hypothetical protein A8709_07320 [Paenibacillus pectinilyticus]|uniref:ORC1/DEAH AAA+ ATPase domain-containing protein n=1 Tax=Paenibacillus pectinilyticus TaxID=512399 RepID=A0A1C0ZTR0_9BACL|nr:ATP-binding protein [Paenibacillus pectinilyticus]OCT11470.1 hypothetical protein A8709_07320 [Paenibacillus pectinilyticus]
MSKSDFNMTTSRKQILAQLYNLTTSQTTGALIIGEPGAGKTTIINAFQALLGDKVPTFVIRSTLYNKGMNASKNLSECFEISLGLLSSRHDTQRTRFQRIINNYIEKTSTTDSGYVVTFIDDVTNWSHDHFYWLIDLQNELAAKNLKTGFFLVGTDKLEFVRHIFMDNSPQIYRRFMNDTIKVSKYESLSVSI